MRAKTIAFLTLIMTTVLSAQEVRDLRIDAGFGNAPRLTGQGRGLRGFHAIVAARISWAELSLHYLARKTGSIEGEYGYGYGNEESASTISLQLGTTVKSSHAQFTISAGLGSFHSKTRVQSYYLYSVTPFERPNEVTRLTIPMDMRMCWNLSEGLGIGFAVFAAYVRDNSYGGYQAFVRVML